MANETKQAVVTNNFKSSAMMIAQNEVISKLQKYAETTKLDYSDYSMQCVDSALSKINDLITNEALSWAHFNTQKGVDNLFSALKYVAFMELNVANQEVAITFRNQKDKNGDITKILEAKIQGVGNDRILKRFGENVAEVKSYIVYEGDEFTFPYMDGFEYILPKYKPMFKSDKVMYGVYLIKLKNGDVDVTIATREDVKISLLAHINQNMRFNDAFTPTLKAKIESMTLDEILYDPNYTNMYVGKTRLISPAWGDFAKERMIARKIRNHALRKWSHNLNFAKKELNDIYQEGWEEERYVIESKPQDVIENNQKEFTEKNSSLEVAETNVGKDVGETLVIKEEVLEPVKVEKPTEDKPKQDDVPSWAL